MLGFTWMAFPLLMFPVAEQWVASPVAGMLDGAMPLGVALVASVMLRRPPGRAQPLGLLIGFAGVVLTGLPSLTGASHTALGAVCVLAALGGRALSYNLAVPLIQEYGAMPVELRVQATGLAHTLPLGLVACGRRTSSGGHASSAPSSPAAPAADHESWHRQ